MSGLLQISGSLAALCLAVAFIPTAHADSIRFEEIEGSVENVVFDGAKVSASDLIAKSTFPIELIVPEEPDFRVSHCSGILIAKDMILTAGHCVPQRAGVRMSIKVGSKNILAAEVERHERYSVKNESDGNQVFRNDLAILRLERAVSGGVPVLLPNEDLGIPENQKVLVAGAGQNGSGSGRLLKTESFASLREPSARRGTSTLVLTGSRSICHGDSGGPTFLRQKSGKLVVIGVHSSGTNARCTDAGDKAFYGFDTYVPSYLNWIRETMNRLSGEDI